MGTIREAYADVLTEMKTEDTQNLYLEDFLYYYNKAISEYMKKRYELFEVTQQLTDDPRVWKKVYPTTELVTNLKVDINDYRHLLGCLVEIDLRMPHKKCVQKVGTAKKYKVTRMTSSIKTGIVDNEYLKATFYRPYFDIIGHDVSIDLGDEPKRKIKSRKVLIEYLRQPKVVNMTEEEVRADDDTSEELEFSRDVGEEIIKVCLLLLLERVGDQRLQSSVAVNQSINDLALK